MKEDKVKKTSPKSTKKTTTKKVVKEEKKESKVVKEKKIKEKTYLDKKDQKSTRILSRILNIIAKIGRIFLMIVVPFLVLMIIAMPFLFNNISVEGNIVKMDNIHLISKGDKYVVRVGDDVYLAKGSSNEIAQVYNYLHDTPKTKAIVAIELGLAFITGMIVIEIYLLSYAEKLFYNIYSKNVPFTDENCGYVRKICNMLVVNVIVSIIAEIVLGLFLPKLPISDYNSISIFGLLIAYVVYYLFKYATSVQKESKATIYD